MRYNDNIGIAAEVNRVQLTFTAIDRRKGTDYMSEQKKKISKLCLADKKIPTFYSDSEIVSVRYYHRDADGYRFEELDEDKLEEFVDALNAMELETGGALDYCLVGGLRLDAAS